MSKQKLFETTWKKYKMDEIFIFKKGKRLVKADMIEGKTNFIASISENNGIRNKIDLDANHQGNCLTVNYNGSVGEAFYQNEPFCASDDVNILYPKNWRLNKHIGLFLTTIIKFNKYRFGYGRKWTMDKMKETFILLPSNEKGLPDFEFMENYIKKIYIPITTQISKKDLFFDTSQWGKFKLTELFYIKGTKTTKLEDLEEYGKGNYPYITTQSANNSVASFYNYYSENGNVLIIDSAVAGFCSYQDKDFSASDHVEKLIPKFNLNKYTGLFLTTIINQENCRYNYGRKFNQEKIKNTTIKLPQTSSGEPDWEYMENYIKALPYSDKI